MHQRVNNFWLFLHLILQYQNRNPDHQQH